MGQAEDAQAVVRLRNIHKSFGANHVLGIDLTVGQGQHVAIFGPSGSGKSTLLRTTNLLETPDSGSVWFDGKEYGPGIEGEDLPRGKARLLREQIGMVFQQFNLFPHITALDNVALALRRVRRMKRDKAEHKAATYLDRVGLLDKLGACRCGRRLSRQTRPEAPDHARCS
jgi:polar amino acid transport system ATP-binding protein